MASSTSIVPYNPNLPYIILLAHLENSTNQTYRHFAEISRLQRACFFLFHAQIGSKLELFSISHQNTTILPFRGRMIRLMKIDQPSRPSDIPLKRMIGHTASVVSTAVARRKAPLLGINLADHVEKMVKQAHNHLLCLMYVENSPPSRQPICLGYKHRGGNTIETLWTRTEEIHREGTCIMRVIEITREVTVHPP